MPKQSHADVAKPNPRGCSFLTALPVVRLYFSAREVSFELLLAHPDRAADPVVRQLRFFDKFVDCRRAQAKKFCDLADCQHFLSPA